MKILELLDELEEIMETGTGLILTGKIMVDPDEVLEIVKEIRAELPEEMEQAKWIKSERQRILDEARRGVARFADPQADRAVSRIRRDALEQLAQALERIGLQARQQGIHGAGLSVLTRAAAGARRFFVAP